LKSYATDVNPSTVALPFVAGGFRHAAIGAFTRHRTKSYLN
jgi:hypothetical protein